MQRRQSRALRRLMALGVFVSLVTSAPALAQDREHVFAWMAPSGPVDAFTIYLGQSSGTYTQTVPLAFVPPDADGATRSAVTLDSALGYFATMTATNQSGESPHSNEIFIAPSACDPAACDDGDPCTADD